MDLQSPPNTGGAALPANEVSKEQKEPQSIFKVVRAALVGTLVEYYDFGIYGYMATYLAVIFFVSDDPTAAMLNTFATFAVAFFMRIPGGIFFGHIGDKYGRKRALSLTILLMAGATALIGLLPSYATLGLWATAILILARCLQGFSAGGEIGGANAFVAEAAPAARRATFTSFVAAGTYLGSLAASGTALLLASVFTEETMQAWAWRIPFLLSLVIGVVGIWIRRTLEDPETFQEIQAEGETAEMPIKALLATSRRQILIIIGLGGLITGGYYIASVYAATYLKTTGGHSAQLAYLSTSIALIVGLALLPLSGYASDRFGRRRVFLTGSISAIVLAYPMFILMGTGVGWHAIIGQVVLFSCVTIVNGTSFAAYSEMLPTVARYSGNALANNVTNTLLGGTAPFIATWLISVTGSPTAPAGYFILCAAFTVVGALFMKESKGIDLQDV